MTTQPKNQKYSIYDDTKAQIFTVTIFNLQKRDAGEYWCGISLFGNDIYAEVTVDVGQDSCCNSVTKIKSYKEDSVTISCPYESEYQNSLKYICRGTRPSTCLQQALITSDNKENGRFRLDDDTVLGKFTVSITRLTRRDSGLYLCGVQRNSGRDVFSAVELQVKAIHILVYFLPAPLVIMLIPTVAWIKVYKCTKVRADIAMNRITINTEEAGEVKLKDHTYENQAVEACFNLDSSEERNNWHIYDNDDGDHVYEDIPETEDMCFTYER
ncbi:polymeric immunoglobulin receptor-like isoform X2 [Simochromis diagramma]|uniref:polymeric immunoglobulin receptor-like isoform X2 n=1 Tax=Simochromis diagramma TaxID=43689 RepID=UPI001A7E1C7B|nr:polymeric immunoglobulin receptor-like isoform X2 [Simochromis diagramma]